MKTVSLWAALALVGLFSAVILYAESLWAASPTAVTATDVQVKNLPVVTRLGEAPFKGAPEVGCQKVVAQGLNSLTVAECQVGLARYKAGQCRLDYIQDGVKAMSFSYWRPVPTSEGKPDRSKHPVRHDEAKLVLLKLQYQTGTHKGQALPSHHSNRKSFRCTTGNKDGAELWLPLTCRNWTTEPPTPPTTSTYVRFSPVSCLYSGAATTLESATLPGSLNLSTCGCCSGLMLRDLPVTNQAEQQIIRHSLYCN